MELVDLKKQYKLIKKEIDGAIKRVLDSSRFIGGEEVENLEAEIARFSGVKYAIGVNSGTDALFVSLKALGIGKGDEVITTPFTFIATAGVIANCGAKPVFVDIKLDTFNINPSKIEKKITKKTKAILPVHLFGQMANMDEIMRIAKNISCMLSKMPPRQLALNTKVKNRGQWGIWVVLASFRLKTSELMAMAEWLQHTTQI